MNRKNIKDSAREIRGVKLIEWITILSLILIIAACVSLKPLKLDPKSQEFYNYARHLFTKHEAHIFRNLTSIEAREKFIENFWEIRDPDPDTEENEFKEEIKKRYEYAVKYLRESHVPGWKTDRGMIFIVLGPPFDKHQDTVLTSSRIIGYIHWYYGYNANTRLFIRFVDRNGDGIYHLDPIYTSLDLLSKLEDMKYQVLKKEDSISKKTKLKFDLEYKSSENNFYIFVKPDIITFEREENKVIVKFKINLVVYRNNEDFTRYAKIKTLELREEELTGKDARIGVVFPLKLARGKYKVDVLLTDLFGEKSKRRFFTIRIK